MKSKNEISTQLQNSNSSSSSSSSSALIQSSSAAQPSTAAQAAAAASPAAISQTTAMQQAVLEETKKMNASRERARKREELHKKLSLALEKIIMDALQDHKDIALIPKILLEHADLLLDLGYPPVTNPCYSLTNLEVAMACLNQASGLALEKDAIEYVARAIKALQELRFDPANHERNNRLSETILSVGLKLYGSNIKGLSLENILLFEKGLELKGPKDKKEMAALQNPFTLLANDSYFTTIDGFLNILYGEGLFWEVKEHIECRRGLESVRKFLNKKSANYKKDDFENPFERTALLHAIHRYSFPMVKLLVEAGSEINSEVLSFALSRCLPSDPKYRDKARRDPANGRRCENAGIFTYLIQQSPKLDFCFSDDIGFYPSGKQFAIRVAVDLGCIELLKVLIVQTPNLPWTIEQHDQPVNFAINLGREEFAILLMEANRFINCLNRSGDTALINALCILKGLSQDAERAIQLLRVIQLLLAKGVDANAIVQSEDLLGQTAIHLASQHQNPKILEMVSEKADINRLDADGQNALIYALEADAFANAKFLIQQGIKVNNVSNSNRHALHAILYGNDLKEKVKTVSTFRDYIVDKSAMYFYLIESGCIIDDVDDGENDEDSLRAKIEEDLEWFMQQACLLEKVKEDGEEEQVKKEQVEKEQKEKAQLEEIKSTILNIKSSYFWILNLFSEQGKCSSLGTAIGKHLPKPKMQPGLFNARRGLDGKTLLHLAIENNNTYLVFELVFHGTRYDMPDNNRNTAFDLMSELQKELVQSYKDLSYIRHLSRTLEFYCQRKEQEIINAKMTQENNHSKQKKDNKETEEHKLGTDKAEIHTGKQIKDKMEIDANPQNKQSKEAIDHRVQSKGQKDNAVQTIAPQNMLFKVKAEQETALQKSFKAYVLELKGSGPKFFKRIQNLKKFANPLDSKETGELLQQNIKTILKIQDQLYTMLYVHFYAVDKVRPWYHLPLAYHVSSAVSKDSPHYSVAQRTGFFLLSHTEIDFDKIPEDLRDTKGASVPKGLEEEDSIGDSERNNNTSNIDDKRLGNPCDVERTKKTLDAFLCSLDTLSAINPSSPQALQFCLFPELAARYLLSESSFPIIKTISLNNNSNNAHFPTILKETFTYIRGQYEDRREKQDSQIRRLLEENAKLVKEQTRLKAELNKVTGEIDKSKVTQEQRASSSSSSSSSSDSLSSSFSSASSSSSSSSSSAAAPNTSNSSSSSSSTSSASASLFTPGTLKTCLQLLLPSPSSSSSSQALVAQTPSVLFSSPTGLVPSSSPTRLVSSSSSSALISSSSSSSSSSLVLPIGAPSAVANVAGLQHGKKRKHESLGDDEGNTSNTDSIVKNTAAQAAQKSQAQATSTESRQGPSPKKVKKAPDA